MSPRSRFQSSGVQNPVPENSAEAMEGKRQHKVPTEPEFPVQPRVISVVCRPKTYMNHSYRDFSSVPAEEDYKEPHRLVEMTFAQKVHDMVSHRAHQDWISWMPHGRSFHIHVPKRLESEGILKKYFGHSRYSSFLRQLSNHGFKHISQGRDRNSYYHEFMLRGCPHLAIYMPSPKDARRLIPDAANEPNFYEISSKFPLPGELASSAHAVIALEETEMGAQSLRGQGGDSKRKTRAADVHNATTRKIARLNPRTDTETVREPSQLAGEGFFGGLVQPALPPRPLAAIPTPMGVTATWPLLPPTSAAMVPRVPAASVRAMASLPPFQDTLPINLGALDHLRQSLTREIGRRQQREQPQWEQQQNVSSQGTLLAYLHLLQEGRYN